MMRFNAAGATAEMSVEAIVALVAWRDAMSPAMRCEKNSMGRRSTCHMKVALPTMANLPSMRSMQTARTMLTAAWTTTTPAMSANSG